MDQDVSVRARVRGAGPSGCTRIRGQMCQQGDSNMGLNSSSEASMSLLRLQTVAGCKQTGSRTLGSQARTWVPTRNFQGRATSILRPHSHKPPESSSLCLQQSTGAISFTGLQRYTAKYGGETLGDTELKSIFRDFRPTVGGHLGGTCNTWKDREARYI